MPGSRALKRQSPHLVWLSLTFGGLGGLAVLAFAAADVLGGGWQPEWWLGTATRGVRALLSRHFVVAAVVALFAALAAMAGASARVRVPSSMRATAVALCAILLFSLLLTPAHYRPEISAWIDAHRDVRRGTPQYFIVGLTPLALAPVQVEAFKERLGVQLHHLGCIPPESIWRYAEEYNSVITPEVERRFGRGIIGRTVRETYTTHPEAASRSR